MTEARAPLELYNMPGHLIRRLQQIAVSIWLDETAVSQIRPVQFAALSAIRAYPGLDQMALSRVVAFDRSTIQDVVVRVVERGWARREADPRDLRRRVLYITEKGARELDSIKAENQRAQQRILEPLSLDEQVAFMEMLSRLVKVNNQFSRAPLGEDRSQWSPADC